MTTNIFQFNWEVNLMVWLQTNVVNTPFMTTLCIIFTYFGEPLMGVLVTGALFWGIDKKFGKYVGLNLLASVVINPLIKNLFFRVRPYFVNESIKCLKAVDESMDTYDMAAQGYSFPSGHAMSSTSVFGSLSAYLKKKAVTIISIIIVTLVCFSRFALGVHYPTDVIVGVVAALLVIFVYTKLQKRFSINKIMLVSAIVFSVGFFYCQTDDYYQLYGLFLGFMLASFFEEKYVNFKNTKNVLKIIIRTLLGGLIFLAVKTILKLPFSDDFMNERNLLVNLVTLFRHLISAFVAMGVYPMIFKYNILKLDDKMKDGD